MRVKNLIYGFFLSLALSAILMACPHGAIATGYEPPYSREWPLVNSITETPRTRVWTSLGEQQYRPDDFRDALHSGTDFRGKYWNVEYDPNVEVRADKVKVMANGNVWFTYQISSCYNLGFRDCRVYILGKRSDQDGNEYEPGESGYNDAEHQYIYYYSHLWLGPESVTEPLDTREKILNATRRGPDEPNPDTGYAVKPGTEVSVGDILCYIANFSGWPHLHFGIYDKRDNYNAINPLTALRRDEPDMCDEQDPEVIEIRFYDAANNLLQVVPVGETNAISGNLDIVANVKDTFEDADRLNDPGDDWAVDGRHQGETIGIYEGRYRIRNVATDVSEEHVWYRFDNAPFECRGDPAYTSCPEFTDIEFYNHTIDHPDGAAIPGLPYSDILYHHMTNTAITFNETNWPIFTNTWGINGSWDTTSTDYPDGMYQVSVQIFDEAGNQDAKTEWVCVNNEDSSCTCDDIIKDAYIRDNRNDVGAIPSNLNGDPFWTSPDIVVVGPTDDPPSSKETAGITEPFIHTQTYRVYVRVHNIFCSTVNNISAKVYSADPSMIINRDVWEEITGGSFQGDLDLSGSEPNNWGYLGPFDWQPTHTGHRCLLAEITSGEDEIGTITSVPENNNIAQRNIQVGETEFYILNPSIYERDIELSFHCRTFPIYDSGASVVLKVEYHRILEEAWTDVPGTILSYDSATNELVLQIQRCIITMPPARFPALLKLPATVELTLPDSASGTFEVYFSELVDGEPQGGMSFPITQIIVP